MNQFYRCFSTLALVVVLTSCAADNNACPVTEPVWLTPPDDAAVVNEPEPSYYFVNEDQSIWASAWWAIPNEQKIDPIEDGVKVGWFRPEGADLTITGRRLDGWAPALEASIPCCYETQFQATGLQFPTEGCWEITAKAGDSQLTFIVSVYP